MRKEGENHRRMREQVIRVINGRIKSDCRIVSAHSGRVESSLYLDEPSRRTHLSDADILILNDKTGRVRGVVEIKDKGIRPKDMIGIMGCTSICDRHVNPVGRCYALKDATLYIVVPDTAMTKNGSAKKNQIDQIVRRMPVNPESVHKYVVCSASEFARCYSEP